MNTKKILIVEDDPDISTTLLYMLEQEGYHVKNVADGEKAVKSIEKDIPDLVILDLYLPKLPGEEVCKYMRSNVKTQVVPIIMLTAKDSEADKIVGRVIGANHYITKPFEMEELLALIKESIVEKKF